MPQKTKHHPRSNRPVLPNFPGLPPLPTPAHFRGNAGMPAIVRGPRGSNIKLPSEQPTEIPMGVLARWPLMTLPEYLTMWSLDSMGLKYGQDYQYQEPLLGLWIRDAGSTIVDFLVINQQPAVALPVQGIHWHPIFGAKLMADLAIFERLQVNLGLVVIPLDEDDLMANAKFVVREAVVNHVDLSRYRGLF